MADEKKLKRALNSGNLSFINTVFEEIYNMYKGLVCYIIAKYISNKEDIFDIAQDVFIDFFNNAEKVNNIKFYLTTMCKNKSINFLKKQSSITLVDASEIDLLKNESSNNQFAFKDVMKVLENNTNHNEYEVLILHLFENYTFKEISVQLSIPESTIKSIYFRTLKKCKKMIERGMIQ